MDGGETRAKNQGEKRDRSDSQAHLTKVHGPSSTTFAQILHPFVSYGRACAFICCGNGSMIGADKRRGVQKLRKGPRMPDQRTMRVVYASVAFGF
jgi:hypothetical protein